MDSIAATSSAAKKVKHLIEQEIKAEDEKRQKEQARRNKAKKR